MDDIKIICDREDLVAVADAIRDKSGTSDEMTLGQMPYTIRNISTGSPDAVLYTEQTLTEEQKAQARENIGVLDVAPQVQSDWNQTDETAADFIKNKPFGASVSEVVLLEPAPLEFYESWNGWQEAYPEFDFEQLKAGNMVTVNFDGVAYELPAVSVSNLSGQAILVGNTRVWDDNDNGIPFSILIASSLMGLSCTFTVYDSSSHTVGISMVAEVVEKLDNKYLNKSVTLYAAFMGDYQFGLCETYEDAEMQTNLITRPRLQELVEQYINIQITSWSTSGGYGPMNVISIDNLYQGGGLGGDAYAVLAAYNVLSDSDNSFDFFYTAEYWDY